MKQILEERMNEEESGDEENSDEEDEESEDYPKTSTKKKSRVEPCTEWPKSSDDQEQDQCQHPRRGRPEEAAETPPEDGCEEPVAPRALMVLPKLLLNADVPNDLGFLLDPRHSIRAPVREDQPGLLPKRCDLVFRADLGSADQRLLLCGALRHRTFPITQLLIAQSNKSRSKAQLIVPRVELKLIEVLVLISNIINAALNFTPCNQSTLYFYTFVINSLNILRLIYRILPLNKNLIVLAKSVWSTTMNFPIFILLIVVISILGYSMFRNELNYCESFPIGILNNSREVQALLFQACLASGFKWAPLANNYNSLPDSLLLTYITLDMTSIFDNLEKLSLAKTGLRSLYLVWQFFLTWFLMTIISISFKSFTLAVTYRNLRNFSSVNVDPTLSLTTAQIEWIQIEEIASETKLLVKILKPISGLSFFCFRVIDSKIWQSMYYCVLLAGFGLNLSTYPRSLN
jgi:hypothetical protein